MSTSGVVRTWDAQEGWGVFDSPETPGGCWAHYSSLAGYSSAQVGQPVRFDYEVVEQDGFLYRATEARPTGGEPEWPTIVVEGSSDAYRSKLTITLDSPEGESEPT